MDILLSSNVKSALPHYGDDGNDDDDNSNGPNVIMGEHK